MKDETQSFYEVVVTRAVERIAQELDQALDLTALASGAGLSPLYFHRIFRGIVGETPLELHRRLRLERAASRLASSGVPVTSVAFEAGYETHESFTRAFREAYSLSPSDFRARSRALDRACARTQCELAARSGVHFENSLRKRLSLSLTEPGGTMKVELETLPERRVAVVSHVGPYNMISQAFARLGELAGRARLIGRAGSEMVAIYHDDPETTPPAELRSDAGITVPEDARLPEELRELRLAAGTYARFTHVGPYTFLGDAWARFMGEWLPQSGRRLSSDVCYEVYRNTPEDTPAGELRTDLYLPLAP